jgi:DNA-cytosine methyltransferase
MVLSLFDGMSCGQLALQRAGIPVEYYFASEIDKYAIAITTKNFPDTVQLGDVNNWIDWNLPKIDLLLGGSPCQGFSHAGHGLNFDDPRSALFFKFVCCLKWYNPTYFLFENVKMKKEWQDIISEQLGVQPTEIDSALVSAQSRKRLYWTNIPNITRPEDKEIFWNDIYEYDSKLAFYYTDKSLNWIMKDENRRKKYKEYHSTDEKKMQMLEASHYKGYSNERCFGIRDINGTRYISPLECERLQTVPEGYTEGVSNTQRYKMLGNGWTIDIIAWILKNIKE